MSINVDDTSFAGEVLESDIPVLVDFWAEWCMPCKMLAPVIDEISSEYEGRVKVCKVNVDNARETAAGYGIMSIPTLIVFKNGEPADKLVGAVSKDAISQKLEEHL